MTGSRLAALLDQATPGEWFVDRQEAEPLRVLANDDRRTIITVLTGAAENPYSKAEARLIALVPDLARLLVDMADALAYVDEWRDRVGIESPEALLARFAALDEKAGAA